MTLIEYPDRDIMMMDLASTLAGELNAALMANDQASLAVPGGTTPAPMFDSLCAADLDWSRVTVMASDERQVPESSERSNARLIRRHLLQGRAAAAQFLSFAVDPQDSLDPQIQALADHLPLSVLVLGMGADMHTASLFPGSPELAAALDPDAAPLMRLQAPGAPEPRLSLSAPVLRGALSVHIVITGSEKRAALTRAEELNDPLTAPICVVLQDATVHWAE
ncbi:MAG: 6-phosphogluconolactonase [Mangrovicoccus sp.]